MLLNDYLKRQISEYADDVLDLESTRQVSDFIESNPEAEAYFRRLQALRRLTFSHLGREEEDSTLEIRMMNALRLRSYDRTWWERFFERRILSPRAALATAFAVFLLVMFLFAWAETPVSHFLTATRAEVEQLREETTTSLSERGGELTESLIELITPPSDENGTKDQVGCILRERTNAV